jgi:prepilin-type N-terminal cleavage/methylation domain-containing protein
VSRSPRGGFTLVELLVAVSLTGLAALLAARTWTGVMEGRAAASAAREALDRKVNAHRWLARAFRSLEVDPSGGGFRGGPDELRFATWLERPEGWLEPGRVALVVEGATLEAITPDGAVVLAAPVEAVDFDYLLEPGADTRWARRWESAASAPLAVRLRIAFAASTGVAARVDTLLFLVGERG